MWRGNYEAGDTGEVLAKKYTKKGVKDVRSFVARLISAG